MDKVCDGVAPEDFDIPKDADLLDIAEEVGLLGDTSRGASSGSDPTSAAGSGSGLPPLSDRTRMAKALDLSVYRIDTPWGKIKFYETGRQIVGESNAFTKPKCHITRTTIESNVAGPLQFSMRVF